ncbi:MAG: hypothetical protein SBU_001168 [Candidatus Syntrophoarchaeum butanivorans]|uniref:Uncharacterized protein n=1 Tax=Candidatus Syntropharchaeum butanivorans TaxID=1839936 RepID=A0A1F2P5N8_9EURY|nr:MAG: hypothetical protein SBU_001168 [Candidatus Syntrophoarchaeum butanivorans]
MGVRIAEERRTEEICKIGRDSGSEGYLPILEHNHEFSQRKGYRRLLSGRGGGD